MAIAAAAGLDGVVVRHRNLPARLPAQQRVERREAKIDLAGGGAAAIREMGNALEFEHAELAPATRRLGLVSHPDFGTPIAVDILKSDFDRGRGIAVDAARDLPDHALAFQRQPIARLLEMHAQRFLAAVA